MTLPPPPEGFEPVALASDFIKMAGPMLGRRGGGRIDLGFRVEQRHCNLWGNCHGGWLSTLADVQLAIACKAHFNHVRPDAAKPPLLATVNMTIDFLDPAPLGSWVEGNAEVLRFGHRTAFAQMTATADGILCLRASGTFKL
jgi:uncharacterized protein (TIGR00369 family)